MIAQDYDSNRDVAELRDESFKILLAVALVGASVVTCGIAVVWAVDWAVDFGSLIPPRVWLASPLWLPALMIFLSSYLKGKDRLEQSKWVLITGLLIGPTLSILLNGPSTIVCMFYILPIAVASVIVGGTSFWLAGLATLLMVSTTAIRVPETGIYALFVALKMTWVPILIVFLLTLITYLHSNIIYTTVQWAIDSHIKDQKRTYLLQKKQEELDKTILQLKVAHSQLQQLNEELIHAKSVAEEANRLKTQFLANMSHELRTPLNAIINFTRFIGKERYGPLTDRQRELQGRVLANADHLLGLINDILDLSKIEAGRMDLIYEEVDILPILQGVMSTAVGLTKDKGLDLTLDVPEELPPVRIDKTRIRQVLLNLLSNAAKFTESGGITVRARSIDAAFLCISVTDTGIGIAPEHQHMIFEEFRQVQGELTRAYQGTGLGLPITKRLVEMHGGKMWLESTPGVGSTFYFTLPIAKVESSTEPSTPLQVSSDSHATVVIVDDDPDSQQILREYLEHAGYSVHSVLDSRTAVETIRTVRPRLVVLDLLMPHIDGWEVLGQLRNAHETADIPVIICSMAERRRLGVALGANAYLVKPVREEELLAHVRRLTSQPATVLVVDDDPDGRRVIRSILEATDYRVVEAENGARGLELVEQARPNLLVLDLMMPEVNGFEVLARLRSSPLYAELPVIIVSAKDLDQRERQWLLSQSQLYIEKSQLSAEQFIDYIRHFVEKGVPHGSRS